MTVHADDLFAEDGPHAHGDRTMIAVYTVPGSGRRSTELGDHADGLRALRRSLADLSAGALVEATASSGVVRSYWQGRSSAFRYAVSEIDRLFGS